MIGDDGVTPAEFVRLGEHEFAADDPKELAAAPGLLAADEPRVAANLGSACLPSPIPSVRARVSKGHPNCLCSSEDDGGRGRRVMWCLGPDSNRHGGSPKGFSYPYSFRCCMHEAHAFVVWTLPLPSRTRSRLGGLGRGRQVSTLSLVRRPQVVA